MPYTNIGCTYTETSPLVNGSAYAQNKPGEGKTQGGGTQDSECSEVNWQ